MACEGGFVLNPFDLAWTLLKEEKYDMGDDAPCPACYGKGILLEYVDDEDEDPTCEACGGSGLMLDTMENERFTTPRAGSSRDLTE